MAMKRKVALRIAILASVVVAVRRATAGSPEKSAAGVDDKRKAALPRGAGELRSTSPRCSTATRRRIFPVRRRPPPASLQRGPWARRRRRARLALRDVPSAANADSTGVPGATDWDAGAAVHGLADARRQGAAEPAICRQLVDRAKHGGPDGPGLIKHHENEPLVRWASRPAGAATERRERRRR